MMWLIKRIFGFSQSSEQSSRQETLQQPKTEIKVIRLEDGQMTVGNPEFLNKFSPEIREAFSRISWLDEHRALRYLAEDLLNREDIETAEDIIERIKQPHRYKGYVSLAIAEYRRSKIEHAQKRIEEMLDQIYQQMTYHKVANLAEIPRFYIETGQKAKAIQIINEIKELNCGLEFYTIWCSIIKPWVKQELEKGNSTDALALESLLSDNYCKVELHIIVAENISQKNPGKAAEILRAAEKIEPTNAHLSRYIKTAWRYIGNQGIDSRTMFSGEFVAAEECIEDAKKSVLNSDKERAKEQLCNAVSALRSVSYSGQYSEEFAYAKSDVYQRIEAVLVEIGDLKGLRKLLNDEFYECTASTHRVHLCMLAVLLQRKEAD